jgi:hypothetical protein
MDEGTRRRPASIWRIVASEQRSDRASTARFQPNRSRTAASCAGVILLEDEARWSEARPRAGGLIAVAVAIRGAIGPGAGRQRGEHDAADNGGEHGKACPDTHGSSPSLVEVCPGLG